MNITTEVTASTSGSPSTPSTATNPSTATTPSTPSTPCTPITASTAGTPSTPSIPSTASIPITPSIPSSATIPSTPSAVSIPSTATTPSTTGSEATCSRRLRYVQRLSVAYATAAEDHGEGWKELKSDGTGGAAAPGGKNRCDRELLREGGKPESGEETILLISQMGNYDVSIEIACALIITINKVI